MACDALIWGLLFLGCSIQMLWATSEDDPLEYMSKEEREALKFVSFTIYVTTNIPRFHFLTITLLYFIGKKRGICFIMHIMHTW